MEMPSDFLPERSGTPSTVSAAYTPSSSSSSSSSASSSSTALSVPSSSSSPSGRSLLKSIASVVFAPLPSYGARHTLGYWLVYLLLVTPIRSVSFLSPPIFLSTLIRLLARSSSSSSTQLSKRSTSFYLPSIFDSKRIPRSLQYFLFFWTASETLFSLYYLFTKRTLQISRSPPPVQGRAHLFDRIRKLITNHSSFISRWFFNTDLQHLKHEDIENWLIWAFFSKTREFLTPSEQSELASMLKAIEGDMNIEFERGCSNAVCVRHTLDPVTSISRPLVYYLVTTSADILFSKYMNALGYQYKSVGCINYWISTPPTRSEKPAIIFIHGIGVGISTYSLIIQRLIRVYGHDRMIILLELKHVSMQLGAIIPNREETLWAIDSIHNIHSIRQSIFVGHSLGTAIVSWVIKHRREYVYKSILVDPVVFMLWEVDVAFNFLYKKPVDAVGLLMYYFVSKELYISHYLHRYFWWYENVLLPDEIGEDKKSCRVFLSRDDTVINAKGVYQHLVDNGINVKVWDGFRHGEFEFSRTALDDIVKAIDDDE